MNKYLKALLFSLIIVIGISACKTHKVVVVKRHPHGMPPGQAKKIAGDRSAKKYAPGQKKKHAAVQKKKH
jgi:hypothetical protein